MSNVLFKRIANLIPELNIKLKQAGINKKPEDFIRVTLISSLYVTLGLGIFIFGILSTSRIPKNFVLAAIALLFVVLFFYLLRVPDAKIMKISKDVSKEIVYVARFLLIEMESGISLYDAMKNAEKNYEATGKYLRDITDRIDMGTSMEDAVNHSINLTPSWEYRRVMWQILNSLQTGADVSKSLNAVIDQIVREQVIEVNRYGKKLNPIAMFYMIVAVILPSLGITMLLVLSSFIGLNLKLSFLLSLVFILGFIQFMFVAIVKSSRPAVEL